ncbi:hypothetical protein AG1IA_08105 [Rhizoctonia solani AG-1 IA]|uniref:Uncharacterized protein n=1 Tax=Thanatephorus cucumeris (strain AG1-IA) TaxID=983506 RepID=L8WIX9_THACA|nr:hypothetical protein AG1IA_08105 [Rhizoctonia solani AG-1 IA]
MLKGNKSTTYTHDFHGLLIWFSPLMIASKMQNIRAKRSVPGSLIPGSPLYRWRS